MFKIEESVLDDGLIDKLVDKLNLMPNDYLYNCKGENILSAVTPEGNILSIAFIHPIDKKEFEKEYINLLPTGDFEWIRDQIIDKIKDKGIWLGTIESTMKSTGAGMKIIDTLKQKYEHIILMSDGGVDYYWQTQNFMGIGTGMFLWSKTPLKI